MLNDEMIIDLYFSRDEKAIDETATKYGSIPRLESEVLAKIL